MPFLAYHLAFIFASLFLLTFTVMAHPGKGKENGKNKHPASYAQPYAAPSSSYQPAYPPTGYPHQYPPAGYPQQPGYTPHSHQSGSSTSHLLATAGAAAVGAAVGSAAVGGIHHTAHKLNRKAHQASRLVGHTIGHALRPPHIHLPHVPHVPGLHHLRPPGPRPHGPRP